MLNFEHDLPFQENLLRQAIECDPSKPENWARLAVMLSDQGQYERAITVVKEALKFHPKDAHFLRALADLLTDRPAHPDRLLALHRLLEIDPSNAGLHLELGHSLLLTPNPAGAITHLRYAVEHGHRGLDELLTLASFERMYGSLEQAIACYEEVLAQYPSNPTAIVERWHLALTVMDWDRAEQLEPQVVDIVEHKACDKVAPWLLLALPVSDPSLLHRALSRHAPSHLHGLGLAHAQRGKVERYRIGYLSADFMQHATASLVANMFAQHDRQRFEIHAISYGPSNQHEITQRIAQSVEHWHDVSQLDDRSINRLLLSLRLDVLVEMKGHTNGARPEISRQRVAPIQIHYLGFPGPVVGFGVDYFVADSVTAPAGSEVEFPQEIIRLPHCYQVNDSDRERPSPLSKTDLACAEDSIVLVNFNQLWKIRPEYMHAWLQALVKHPKAELCLLSPEESEPLAHANLTRWAQRQGFGSALARVHFLPRLKHQQHINRLAAADLALDQLPCSSHTTASDALWAGVPLLTQIGNTFAGRVGASVVSAAQCPDLVCTTLEAYQSKLNELLHAPDSLRAYKAQLNANRTQLPLFDTRKWVSDWERALIELCRKHDIVANTAQA